MQVAAVLRAGAVLSLLACAPILAGFSATSAFESSAEVGGGGGMAFTGSASSHGLSCKNCHQGTGAAGGVGLASVPPGLFSTGYVPDTVDRIAVRLQPERKGLDRNGKCVGHLGGCNRNAFVAEFLGKNAIPVGQLCTDSGVLGASGCDNESGTQTTLFSYGRAVGGISLKDPAICGGPVTADCVDVAGLSYDQAATAIGAAVTGRTAWEFQWRSPSDGQPVGFWLGVVDGDGGTRVTTDHNDYYGDDTYLISRTLWQNGHLPAATAGGCEAERTARWPAVAVAGWAFAFLAWRRRSLRSTAGHGAATPINRRQL